MDYVISHFWTIVIGSLIVAFSAVLWWYLMDKNARLKRERAQARIAEAKRRKEAREASEKGEREIDGNPGDGNSPA